MVTSNRPLLLCHFPGEQRLSIQDVKNSFNDFEVTRRAPGRKPAPLRHSDSRMRLPHLMIIPVTATYRQECHLTDRTRLVYRLLKDRLNRLYFF